MWRGTGVIASTNLDSQGERLTRLQLSRLVAHIGQRAAIHQQHDMSLPVCGYMSNPRIEQARTEPGEFELVVDIESVDDSPPPFQGLSWSSTEPLAANCDLPHIALYLPYPLYNDNSLVESLLVLDGEILVGKWRKKAAEPTLIALLVDLVVDLCADGSKVMLAAIFMKELCPRIAPLLAKATELWASRRMVTDIRKTVRTSQGRLDVHLCPDRVDPVGGYEAQAIAEMIALAVELARENGGSNDGPIVCVRAVFDRTKRKYTPIALCFESGTVTHVVDP
ncbi:MAG: hypothetical protein ACOYOB_17365 [Myxococcota bacterium]